MRGIIDNLLTVNSWVAEKKARKSDGYLLFADLEKCFDKLWLRDCIKEVCEAGMSIPEATCILKMNRDVKATVDTPFGMSESFEAEEIVWQGMVKVPQLCSVSTDRINKMQDNINTEVSEVVVKSAVFVDDMNGMGSAEKIEDMGRKMKWIRSVKEIQFQ